MEHDLQDELRDAPLLKGVRGNDPFVVPEGFMDRFPHQVQQAATPMPRTVGAAWERARWYWPAGIAIGMLAVLFILRHPGTDPGATPLAEELIDPYELGLLGSDDASTLLLEADGPTLADVYLPVTDDELLGYIASEEIALDLLIEEL